MDYREAKQQAMSEACQRAGKPESEMVPWRDYDPIMIDNRARELINPGIRWTGD